MMVGQESFVCMIVRCLLTPENCIYNFTVMGHLHNVYPRYRGCRRRVSEVQSMHPEQERHAQTQRVEDKVQELDKELRFLHWQISKIEKMVRIALEQVKIINLSAP